MEDLGGLENDFRGLGDGAKGWLCLRDGEGDEGGGGEEEGEEEKVHEGYRVRSRFLEAVGQKTDSGGTQKFPIPELTAALGLESKLPSPGEKGSGFPINWKHQF